jgi:hypothetical protein
MGEETTWPASQMNAAHSSAVDEGGRPGNHILNIAALLCTRQKRKRHRDRLTQNGLSDYGRVVEDAQHHHRILTPTSSGGKAESTIGLRVSVRKKRTNMI